MFRSTCAPNLQPSPGVRIVLQLLSSLQYITSVKGIALGGDEAGVGDDAAEFAFVGAVFNAGGEDHVFFDEDAADVVGAELQADLADFNSGREPARLDVVDVVEIQAAHRPPFPRTPPHSFPHLF